MINLFIALTTLCCGSQTLFDSCKSKANISSIGQSLTPNVHLSSWQTRGRGCPSIQLIHFRNAAASFFWAAYAQTPSTWSGLKPVSFPESAPPTFLGDRQN